MRPRQTYRTSLATLHATDPSPECVLQLLATSQFSSVAGGLSEKTNLLWTIQLNLNDIIFGLTCIFSPTADPENRREG